MKSRQEILAILGKEKPELEKQFGIRRLALFGSYARGDQEADSDVDVLVDVDPKIGMRFVLLAERIEAVLGLPVELVSRRAIKPRNWTVIKKELVDVE